MQVVLSGFSVRLFVLSRQNLYVVWLYVFCCSVVFSTLVGVCVLVLCGPSC